MGPDTYRPFWRSASETVEEKLQEVRAMHPGWSIIPVFAGWLAVPSGIPVVQSMDLDGIDEKISAVEQDPGL